ncbi:MAG TPA: phosphatase PAP2 family protein [Terracidiphilus sp.]|nr:phosphatase PAP2 family protein [Terracidiphilus sp.]
MLNFLRRRLDELMTGSFLCLVLVLVLLCHVDFATPGGLLLAQLVIGSIALIVAVLLIAVRFTPRVRPLLRIVVEIGPMVVAVLGYVSLKLFHASVITIWLGISSKDQWMMAADVVLFGKTPYLWFSQWGLDSRLSLQVMSSFYGLYPFTPLIVLSWFMHRGDMEQLRLIRRTLLISFYCGYCFYILFPVSGPLSLTTPAKPLFIESTLTYTFLMGNFRFATDCFPSLHTANPWLMAWLCRGKLPSWLMAVAIIVCTGITLSTIALRFHYGIDDIAGLVWIFPVSLLARASLPHETAA